MSSSDEASRKVGYKNPPAEHRFKKGVSGNPKGRPRKERPLVATMIGGKPGIGFEDPIKTLALREAYRMITVREGGRVENIPAIQAIIRKLVISAVNGNARAQQTLLTLVTESEAGRRLAEAELLARAVDYKEYWIAELAEREQNGTSGPDPMPHPDDVVIDPETCEVRIEGPVLAEQKVAWDRLHIMQPGLEKELAEINTQIAAEGDNLALRRKQRELTKIVDSLREDAAKRSARKSFEDPGHD